MPTLETLPPEIIYHIVSFTSPFSRQPPSRNVPLPLLALSETNKYLFSIVEEYTRVLLKKHANLAPKLSRNQTHRKKWIKWVANTCQMCKKKSKRAAILDLTMTLCSTCDRKFIPKMTMTKAITEHNLSKLDLFTPNILHDNLPPLATGTYVCMGGDSMMILEADVLARKDYIHAKLGEKAQDAIFMKKRCRAHDRIMRQFRLMFVGGQWSRSSKMPCPPDMKRLRELDKMKAQGERELAAQRAMMGASGASSDFPITRRRGERA